MKKFKIIAYIALVIMIIVLISVISINVVNGSDNDEQTKKEKALSEIRYLDTQLTNMFNTMNNIEYSNLRLSKTAEKKESSSSESGGESSSSSSSSDSSSGGESQSSTPNKDNVKFEATQSGILADDNQEINWGYLKNETEKLYASNATITLDLYSINLNQQDILDFNKKIDELVDEIKQEDKEKTLTKLTQLYSYIPKFTLNATDKEEYKITAAVKYNIFLGYKDIDADEKSNKWDDIYNNISNAINEYTGLLSITTIDETRKNKINKTYIALNELQNSVKNKSKDTFLIKYKNLMEELGSL